MLWFIEAFNENEPFFPRFVPTDSAALIVSGSVSDVDDDTDGNLYEELAERPILTPLMLKL